jgi:pantoate--beta-alanine ligase
LAGTTGTVAVSIFVNPTQFGPHEDFSRYPRTFAADRKMCRRAGVDLIFHPTPAEMYPEGFSTYVGENTVSSLLCGASRPGHFRGVCTVVLKLFQIIQPQIAIFGLKDYQQCAVIRRMVRDLNLPIRIVTAETVREPDGLALSSRNQYLTAEERSQAPGLRAALLAAREARRAGESDAAVLRRVVVGRIRKASLARIDYVEIVDGRTLQPVRAATAQSVIALAVFFGQTRLIDNIRLG